MGARERSGATRLDARYVRAHPGGRRPKCMRFLYVCADPGIPVFATKGASVHVRAMIRALRRAGHDVTLAAPVLHRHEPDATAELDATLWHVPVDEAVKSTVDRLRAADELLGGDTGIANEVRRVLAGRVMVESVLPRLRDDPPDAIYERLSLMGTAGAELARELGVPLLVEVNSPLRLEASAYRRLNLDGLAARAEQLTLRQAAAVLAVSDEVRDYAIGAGAAPERTHVAPNGIDPAEFAPRPPDGALRARLGASAGETLLGFVGGLRPWHGVEALPELLHTLIDRGCAVRMAIIGDGPLRGRLERDFQERDVAEHVRFTGAVDHREVAALTSQLDVALAPYAPLDHAFYFSPLKLFEYMGAGVAVVASRIGQIAQVIDDGTTGVLVAPGDLSALIDACERLIRDPAGRARLGRAAAAAVRSGYTWDRNAERVAALAADLHTAGAAR